MHPLTQILLGLSLISGLAYLLSSNLRPLLGKVFLAILTAFVVAGLALSPLHKALTEPSVSSIELDRAELSLHMVTAFQASQQAAAKATEPVRKFHRVRAPFKPDQMVNEVISQCYTQAISALEKRSSAASQSDLLQAELMIVCADSGDHTLTEKICQARRHLAQSSDRTMNDLGVALTSIYTSDRLSAAQAYKFQKLLQQTLPNGWYQNAALLHLFKVSGQTQAFEKLQASANWHSLSFAKRTVEILLITMLAALTGVITIVMYFASEFQTSNKKDHFTPSAQWTLVTTYGVLVGWMATQVILQAILTSFAKPFLQPLLQSHSVSAALVTAGIYLLTAIPAIVFIWWFACRPHGISFFEAVKLKLPTTSSGLPMLIAAGILTWCAALPVVLGAQLITFKFFSSHGSSNPILSLVRDAAHTPSIAVIAIYLIILGVLAPLMEETLFRGFLYSSLRKKFGRFFATGGSAALFALAHFDPGGFIALFVLGCLFAIVFEKNQNLVPSMIAHGMWNSGTFAIVLLLFGTD